MLMSGSYRSRIGVALTTLLALLAHAAPARAQGVPESMLRSSRDTTVIKSQLRLAVTLGGEVLAGLQATPTDDSVPLDPVMVKKARETYALVRAGRHGFELENEWNEGKKGILPDPIKELAFKRVDKAWNLSRTPIESLTSAGVSRADYLQRSTEDLGKAIQLLNQALAILP
jgi:hypothetical protein